MSAISSPLMMGGGGTAAFEVSRSLRLNRSDAPSLYRTTTTYPSSGSSATVSFWIKRSELSASNNSNRTYLFYTGNSSGTGTILALEFNSDSLAVWLDGSSVSLLTTAKFVDTTAWMHILFRLKSSEGISSDRLKLYANGVQITSFSTATYPSSFFMYAFSPGNDMWITDKLSQNRQSGSYIADYYFIDGQALAPDSFTEQVDGVLCPKAYSGSYGNNGFHLTFSDNSTASSSGIGKDTSGLNNDFTPVNISVASGVGNDSLFDTPTRYGSDTGAGGEVRGNYSTLNSFRRGSAVVLKNGNLNVEMLPADPNTRGYSTLGMTTGKWYCEVEAISGASSPIFGIAKKDSGLYEYPGYDGTSYGYYPSSAIFYNAGMGSSYGTLSPAFYAYGIIFDADNGTLSFTSDGLDQGVAAASIPAGTYFFAIGNAGEFNATFNFGQRPFFYNAPDGYKTLSSQSLPSEDVITSGSFTGNSSSDGPFIYLNGAPSTLLINGYAVTWGTHANKYATGFKVITSLSAYNFTGINSFGVSVSGAAIKNGRALTNP